MSYNLLRNSKVFFTTAVDTSGRLTGNFSTTNTFEIQVLDGLSFSQNTTSETVTINEGGASPTRGQISYNTSIEPVDWSFSTYMRPKASFTTRATCEERVLWNALASTTTVPATGTHVTAWPTTAAWKEDSTGGILSLDQSNYHQLQQFALVIAMDNNVYVLENCAIESASIDFGIDAIATVAWTGRAVSMTLVTSAPTFSTTVDSAGTVTGVTVANYVNSAGNSWSNITGPIFQRITDGKYIANKLSIAEVTPGYSKTSDSSTFNVAITGGNITIANNLTYLTPATIGVVNEPCSFFTGTRSVSGSLTAYLRAGGSTSNTVGLLGNLLAKKLDDQNGYTTLIKLGGTGAPRIEVKMDGAQLQIPSINTDQVVSTTINFTGHPFTNVTPDITKGNEVTIKYFAA